MNQRNLQNPVQELLKFYKEIGAGFVEIDKAFLNKKRNTNTKPLRQTVKPVTYNQKTHPKQISQTFTDSIEKINTDISKCNLCDLHKSKTNYVPGEGFSKPEILFIGEGPGEQEDKSGRPFVGEAGLLLDKIIGKMGYSRNNIYITNIVKCRPPNNRTPNKAEAKACFSFLRRQIDFLKPKIIVCLGKTAINHLMGKELYITKVRGTKFEYNNIPVIPTFHPSYILHQNSNEATSKAKWAVWSDMEKVLSILKNSK